MILLFQKVKFAQLEKLIQRKAGLTVVLTLCITLVFAAALPQLRFENNSGKLDLPADDRVKVARDSFESIFGGDKTIIIGLAFGHRIDASDLQLIQKLTDDCSQLNGVNSVLSITNAVKFNWISILAIYALRPTLLIPTEDRGDDSKAHQAINAVVNDPLYSHALISPDGRSTALSVKINPQVVTGLTEINRLKRLVNELKQITQAAENRGVKLHFAGPAVLNIALQEAMRKDLGVFGVLSLVSFFIIMIIIFWAWRPVLAGFATALIALIWSLGILPLTGTPMSIGLSMIVPLVLSLTLMYSIHHLACIFYATRSNSDESHVTLCWRSLIAPGILCGITSCIGFASLGISSLPGIREVGIFIGFGAIVSMILANLFLPAMLNLLGWRGGRRIQPKSEGYIVILVRRLYSAILLNPARIIGLVIVFIIISGFGILRLRAETNHLTYLPSDHTVNKSFRFVDTHFGGVLPMEILVDIPIRHAADPIKRLLTVEDSIRAIPGIGSVISAADIVYEAESAKPEKLVPLKPALHLDEGYIPIQIWRLINAYSERGRYVYQQDTVMAVRVSCRTHVVDSGRLQMILLQVTELFNRHFPDYPVVITGLAPYLARIESYIMSTQIESFALALTVTVILLGLLGGTFRMGMVAAAVNIFPIIIVLGIMGWLAVPLDISTVMIASIAIGIVVDDTIHLIYKYQKEILTDKSPEAALAGALSTVGLPVITTTIVLTSGFACLLPARFMPTAYFGGLSALIVLLAGVFDIIILPAVILLLERRRISGRSLV